MERSVNDYISQIPILNMDLRFLLKSKKKIIIIHVFVLHHVKREHNCVFKNSSVCTYIGNQTAEYL